MDNSDLDSYQNIVLKNSGEKKSRNNPNTSNPTLNYTQVCQVCGVYLKIDSNILNMNEPTYKQLSNTFNFRDDFETTLSGNLDTDMELSVNANLVLGSSSSANNPIGGQSASSTINPAILSQNASSSNNEESGGTGVGVSGFMEPLYRKSIAPYLFATLGDSTSNQQSSTLMMNQQDMMTGWSARINETSALFDMMSSNTSIDHPLCEECADLLVNQLDGQCKIVEKEYADYTQLITRLNQQLNNESEIGQLEKELAELELEEQELTKKIQSEFFKIDGINFISY